MAGVHCVAITVAAAAAAAAAIAVGVAVAFGAAIAVGVGAGVVYSDKTGGRCGLVRRRGYVVIRGVGPGSRFRRCRQHPGQKMVVRVLVSSTQAGV